MLLARTVAGTPWPASNSRATSLLFQELAAASQRIAELQEEAKSLSKSSLNPGFHAEAASTAERHAQQEQDWKEALSQTCRRCCCQCPRSLSL